MNLLIGSKALLFHDQKLLESGASRSFDTDWITTFGTHEKFINKHTPKSILTSKGKSFSVITNNNNINEFEIAWKDSTAEKLLKIIKEDKHNKLFTFHHGVRVAKPNVIFTLKKSHRYLKNSPHFMKTMLDYNHLKKAGCSVPVALKEWYKEREKETYSYRHPKLDVSKDEFFKDDQVPYIYDHDTIHLAMKHLDRPAYEYFKADKAEVKCSKELFFSCPEEVRLFAVLEEAYVLALERSQIPAPGVITPKQSFEIALMKICTSITSGWFRAYAYENYFKVINMFNENYIDVFWFGVKNGIVKKI